MTSIDKLTVTEYSESEAFKKKEASVAKAIGDKSIDGLDENEDLGDDSDGEPPKFLFGYRGKPKAPAVGNDLRSNANSVKPDKQGGNSKAKEEEPDELDKRAIKVKAKADKKTK